MSNPTPAELKADAEPLSDAELSTRLRLTYIKGGEREALNTALYWQSKHLSTAVKVEEVERKLESVKKSFKEVASEEHLTYWRDRAQKAEIILNKISTRAGMKGDKP